MTGSAQGIDAVAALQFALQKLAVDLHRTTYHREGRMHWHEEGAGYGFIVPKRARDLLRGDGATYYG